MAGSSKAYEEALSIRRELAKGNPAAWLKGLSNTLQHTAKFYFEIHRTEDAKIVCREALIIERKLAVANPEPGLREI